MDMREFARQIKAAWELFDADLCVGRALVCPASLPVDVQFRTVALADEASYADIYRMGLSRSAYNFVLMDYSYFQFSLADSTSWRLGYFPNPWITGSSGAQQKVEEWEALEAMGGLTHEDASSLIEELPYQAAVPPIRFEYSRAQYREIAHPAAHFHVGRNTNNRWPCALLLGPVAFAMLIARLYYPEPWKRRSSYEGGRRETCLEHRFGAVMRRSESVREFTEIERQALHLGRGTAAIRDTSQPLQRNRGGRRVKQLPGSAASGLTTTTLHSTGLADGADLPKVVGPSIVPMQTPNPAHAP
jgi:hypothetical protein